MHRKRTIILFVCTRFPFDFRFLACLFNGLIKFSYGALGSQVSQTELGEVVDVFRSRWRVLRLWHWQWHESIWFFGEPFTFAFTQQIKRIYNANTPHWANIRHVAGTKCDLWMGGFSESQQWVRPPKRSFKVGNRM